jgi:hypothetical protein
MGSVGVQGGARHLLSNDFPELVVFSNALCKDAHRGVALRARSKAQQLQRTRFQSACDLDRLELRHPSLLVLQSEYK